MNGGCLPEDLVLAARREEIGWAAMPLLETVKVLVSIMMSVNVSNKGKPLKLRHYDISRAHFQGTAQRLIYI